MGGWSSAARGYVTESIGLRGSRAPGNRLYACDGNGTCRYVGESVTTPEEIDLQWRVRSPEMAEIYPSIVMRYSQTRSKVRSFIGSISRMYAQDEPSVVHVGAAVSDCASKRETIEHHWRISNVDLSECAVMNLDVWYLDSALCVRLDADMRSHLSKQERVRVSFLDCEVAKLRLESVICNDVPHLDAHFESAMT